MEKVRKARGKATARVPMSIHFDSDDYAALVVEADGKGCSMQKIVRGAVRRALKGDESATGG